MRDYMNGFIKTLSRPNSAEQLYEAGVALDRLIGDSYDRQERAGGMRSGGMRSGDDSILMSDARRGRGNYGDDTYDRRGRQYRSGAGRELYKLPEDSDTGRGNREPGSGLDAKKEIDEIMLEVEDQLIDILNRGNPDPRAREPGAPRRVPYFMRDPRKQRRMQGNNPSYRENP